MVEVFTPVAGVIVALADVPDLVFAEAMVGPGVAINPEPGTGVITAVSPLQGTVGALHPHAYAVEGAGGAVLVHLGIDTVTLEGGPFRTLVTQGESVRQGEPIVEWNVAEIGALSPLVPVVALGASSVTLHVSPGERVEAGARLFTID